MRNVQFTSWDFELFESDITIEDYEFFTKHEGAFKAMLEDQSQVRKMQFVRAFKDFSVNHGCVKDLNFKADIVDDLVESVEKHLTEYFVFGRVNKAKYLIADAVCLIKNRGSLSAINSNSYAKDPFIQKETRDVFRRLFGEPKQKDACIKALCLLPLYVKFGGSICRYLRRWVKAGKLEEISVASTRTEPTSLKSKPTPAKSTAGNEPVSNDANSSKSTGATEPVVRSPPSGEKSSSSDSDDDDDEEGGWYDTIDTNDSSPLPHENVEDHEGDRDSSFGRLREDLLLGKAHPNQEFDDRCRKREEERLERNRPHEETMKDYSKRPMDAGRRHHCSNCKKVENTRGMFKKCERCKGKGTKFYCSRECQGEDWESRHRQHHSTVEQLL